MEEILRRIFNPTPEEDERAWVESRTVYYGRGTYFDPEVMRAAGLDLGFYRYVCVDPDEAAHRRDERRWQKIQRRGKRAGK